jgi:hypothetical protein
MVRADPAVLQFTVAKEFWINTRPRARGGMLDCVKKPFTGFAEHDCPRYSRVEIEKQLLQSLHIYNE